MESTWLTATIGSGFAGLFVISFLAATLLPLGSEWLLATLLMAGRDPVVTIAVATLGNVLGSLVTWMIGRYGGTFFVRRLLRIDQAAQQNAEARYARFGVWSLLLAWVPVIGDPLCLIAGVLKVDLARFVPLVTAGKLGRYVVLGWLTLSCAN